MSLVLNGTTGITNLPSINSGQIGGRRNIVYNGEMKVAQRSTSETGLGAASGYFTLDRWYAQTAASAGRFTMAQVADGPAGIANCLKISTTTADTSIAAGEYLLLRQKFEGQDLQQLKKGTASAEQFTVSFWVKGNAAALYVCELQDADNTRTIAQSFAVTTSWNRIELTFAADTSGPLDDDNAVSLNISFWLHAGATYAGGTFTSNTWQAQTEANRVAVDGFTSIYDSTDRTFFITGIQMEIGSTATDFESRSFGEELALCQRYTYLFKFETVSAVITAMQAYGVASAFGGISVPKMRAIPTASFSALGDFTLTDSGSTAAVTSGITLSPASNSLKIIASRTGSGLVAGNATLFLTSNTSAFILLSAEL